MTSTNLHPGDPVSSSLFINRELSWLAFNQRVLAQAADPSIPLLERLKFLTICGSNLDEFFEVRVAGIKQQIALGVAHDDPDGVDSKTLLYEIQQRTRRLVDVQYDLLSHALLPELKHKGVALLKWDAWSAPLCAWLKNYFVREVLPLLAPVALDPAHPFPNIPNKSLSFILTLQGKDAFGRCVDHAILQVPRVLPRLTQVPSQYIDATIAAQAKPYSPTCFVTLTALIRGFADLLIPGMRVLSCDQFRITRNSDLWVDSDGAGDLLSAVSGQLGRRNYGAIVRLELTDHCSEKDEAFLLAALKLPREDLYRVKGPVNVNRLAAIYDLSDRPDLKYPRVKPRVTLGLQQQDDPFSTIRKRDVVLHHPFDDFSPIVWLLQKAASDPQTLSIAMTLYRTGVDSPVAKALMAAARAGKQVTAIIELRARFDEQTNVDLAGRLQEVGVNVAYGLVGYKTHAKMLLIIRREKTGLNRYVHLGTGNYHIKTSQSYTDVSYLTARARIGADVQELFRQLTGRGRIRKLSHLVHAPFSLKNSLLKWIDAEADAANNSRPARILIKVNSLTDPDLVLALYRASQAGVFIDLIVRGVCILRPGVTGLSDRIQVRSIVGRFLEHSRVFYFFADGDEKVFCGSADWMSRNLHRRFECVFPILDPLLKKRIIEECLTNYLRDNAQAFQLQSDGHYERLFLSEKYAHSAQEALLLAS
jgi:polyphosphate kinase